MEILDKYKEELDQDTNINMLNLRDSQLRLPNIKHKWAARLINHKVELDKTESLIVKAKEAIIEKQMNNAQVKLSRPSLEKSAEEHDTVIRLKARVKEEEFIIMYLEKVEKILSSITYDIRNLTDILKLEQL